MKHKVKLAHGWGKHQPGADVTVDDADYVSLTRGGYVAHDYADDQPEHKPEAKPEHKPEATKPEARK